MYVACMSLFLVCSLNAHLYVHFVYYTCVLIACTAHTCTCAHTHCAYCACMHVCTFVHCLHYTCMHMCVPIVYCAQTYVCIHLSIVYIIHVFMCVPIECAVHTCMFIACTVRVRIHVGVCLVYWGAYTRACTFYTSECGFVCVLSPLYFSGSTTDVDRKADTFSQPLAPQSCPHLSAVPLPLLQGQHWRGTRHRLCASGGKT